MFEHLAGNPGKRLAFVRRPSLNVPTMDAEVGAVAAQKNVVAKYARVRVRPSPVEAQGGLSP